MKGYKGFDKNLQCKGLQYKVGETAEEKEAKLCSKGLHFCENPFDVFDYYPPSSGRFCEVEADNVSGETRYDSKRVAKKLHIKAEIGLSGLIQAGVKFILDKVKFEDKDKVTGNYSGASATGDCSGASATGYRSGASAGKGSVALATGMLSRAKGDLGAFIILTECEEVNNEYFIKDVKCTKVDREKIKADTWYFLKNGKFVEADERDY